MSVLDEVRTWARQTPNAIAVESEREAFSFAELIDRADAFSEWLPERAVVATVLESGPRLTAASLGTFACGAVLLPLPLKSATSELEAVFRYLLPDVIVAKPEHAGPARAALERVAKDAAAAVLWVDPNDPEHNDPEQTDTEHSAPEQTDTTQTDSSSANFIPWTGPRNRAPAIDAPCLPPGVAVAQLTSGSTGIPKIILLHQDAVHAALQQSRPFTKRFTGRAVFSPMPQFHAMGGAIVLEHLTAGSSVLVTNRFLPGHDGTRIQQSECALLAASPEYIRILLKLGMWKKNPLPKLTDLVLGSAATDRALIEHVRQAAPNLSIHIRYGLSEAYGALTRLEIPPNAAVPPRGLVGAPLPGVELAGVELAGAESAGAELAGVGEEIRVRTDAAALGWVAEPNRVARLVDEEGFLATGDLGFRDAAGLHIQGRRSQFIKRLGHRIEPGEIEHVLLADPAVDAAVVVGVADPLAGANIVAVVEGSAANRDLVARCREHLAPHKVPQQVVNMTIPRTQSGKPNRAAVQETMARRPKTKATKDD